MKFYAIFFVLIGVTLHLGVGAPLEEHEVVDDTNEAPLDEDQVVDETTLAPLDEDTNEVLELPTERNETIKGYVFEAVDPEEEGTEGESGDGSHPPQILVLIEDDSTNSGKNDFMQVMDASDSQVVQEDQTIIEVDSEDNQFIMVPFIEEPNDANNTKNHTNEFDSETLSSENLAQDNGNDTQAKSVDSEGSEDEYKTPIHLFNIDFEKEGTESVVTSPENPQTDDEEGTPTVLKEDD